MRELFFKIFADSFFNTGIQITPFSIAHIVYMVLIFGSIILGWLCLRNQSAEKKEKALRFLAYALVISYLSDFFVHHVSLPFLSSIMHILALTSATLSVRNSL